MARACPRDTNEQAKRNGDIKLLQIVGGGANNFQQSLGFDRAAGLWNRHPFRAPKIVAGQGNAGQFWEQMRSAAVNQLAAFLAPSGADLDEVIGGANDRLLMLYDEQRVAAGGELVHDLDKLVGVTGMQAHAGFVEHEEGIYE